MNTIFRNLTVQVLDLNCSYKKAFDKLKDPLFQKEWGVNFFEDIYAEAGEYVAVTRFGKMKLRIDADESLGHIHTYINGAWTNPSLLVKNGENTCVYIFVLMKPSVASEDMFQQEGVPNLLVDLWNLKRILESN